MTPDLAGAVYDHLVPGWREAPKNGEEATEDGRPELDNDAKREISRIAKKYFKAKSDEHQMEQLRGIYVDEESKRMFILSERILWLADIPVGAE